MIYLAPLKKWVVDILEGRENNSKVSNEDSRYCRAVSDD